MAPKRKATGEGSKRSKKPKKAPTPEDTPPTSPRPSGNDSGGNKVRWALPVIDRANTAPDTSDNVTRFAPMLYNRTWDELTTREVPFGAPRLRTPLYKQAPKNPYTPPQKNVSRTSQAVLNLFDVISRDSLPIKREPADQPAAYARNTFEQAFGGGDDDIAIVASRSTAHPVLALTQDYRVQV